MPLPKPLGDETQDEFISRCISWVMDKGEAETVEQAAAICYSQWEDRSGLTRAVESDWRPLLDLMTEKQRSVHEKGQTTESDEQEIARTIVDNSKESYRASLQSEYEEWGGVEQRASTPKGEELERLEDRAAWAAATIRHTYNLNLALEILRIGEENPEATEQYYEDELYGAEDSWDAEYWKDKALQVAQIEVLWAIYRAIRDFYDHNQYRLDVENYEVLVMPLVAVCPVCQELVANNPYPSTEALSSVATFPVHPNCPHHQQTMVRVKLSREECQGLWLGR
jgi:uncharacterized CHY-type Zn-finger protein